mgnify:CR=1 FL=1
MISVKHVLKTRITNCDETNQGLSACIGEYYQNKTHQEIFGIALNMSIIKLGGLDFRVSEKKFFLSINFRIQPSLCMYILSTLAKFWPIWSKIGYAKLKKLFIKYRY